VDGHPIVRAALRHLLSTQEGLRVAGKAGDGPAAIELMRSTALDVLIMDLALAGQSGLEVLARIRSEFPKTAILIFTGYSQEQYAVSVFRQGVSGFLSKASEPREIVNAIRVVSKGERYITPVAANRLAARLNNEIDDPHEQLSERELQVSLKLATGVRPGAIAISMSLSVKTVSTYRSRLMEKLQLSSNSNLTYYALKHQLLDKDRAQPGGSLGDLSLPREAQGTQVEDSAHRSQQPVFGEGLDFRADSRAARPGLCCFARRCSRACSSGIENAAGLLKQADLAGPHGSLPPALL
jgi:two-component system invasion response regulator UvrY